MDILGAIGELTLMIFCLYYSNKLLSIAFSITSNLSVSEIAYQLGFEFPQSFNKLFKKKTNLTPLEFKQSFN